MLDFMVLVLLTLKWLKILWLGFIHWYNQPRRLYKGSVKCASHKSRNRDADNTCVVSTVTSPLCTAVKQSESQIIDNSDLTLDGEKENNNQPLLQDREKELAKAAAVGKHAKKKGKDGNGYLISSSLLQCRKSKSKSPPAKTADTAKLSKSRKSKSPDKPVGLKPDIIPVQSSTPKRSITFEDEFEPLQTSTPSPTDSSGDTIDGFIGDTSDKSKTFTSQPRHVTFTPDINSHTPPVSNFRVDWATRTLVCASTAQISFPSSRSTVLLTAELESAEPLKCLIEKYRSTETSTDVTTYCDIETRLRYIVEKRALVETSYKAQFAYLTPTSDVKKDPRKDTQTEHFAVDYRVHELESHEAIFTKSPDLEHLLKEFGLSKSDILKLEMAHGRDSNSDSENRYINREFVPSVDRIRVYERFMEGFTKDVLSAMARRRKSFETQSYSSPSDTLSDDGGCCFRRRRPVIVRRALRRDVPTVDIEPHTSDYRKTGIDTDRKDPPKYESSSRHHLTEGMIRTKISQHMSNIIGQKLYPDDTTRDIMNISWNRGERRPEVDQRVTELDEDEPEMTLKIQDVNDDTEDISVDISSSKGIGYSCDTDSQSVASTRESSEWRTESLISDTDIDIESIKSEDYSDLVNFPFASILTRRDTVDSFDENIEDLKKLVHESKAMHITESKEPERNGVSSEDMRDYLLARRHQVSHSSNRTRFFHNLVLF